MPFGGRDPGRECDTAFAQAQKANEQNAPRFDNRQTCEEQYGVAQCVPRNNGSFFSPLLTGFIVGQMMGIWAAAIAGPLCIATASAAIMAAPAGRSRAIMRPGGPGSGRTPSTPAARAPARVQSRSAVISRGRFGGGFGSRSYGG
jgi:uncharacterized protein YgiB involved in biofilm formation